MIFLYCVLRQLGMTIKQTLQSSRVLALWSPSSIKFKALLLSKSPKLILIHLMSAYNLLEVWSKTEINSFTSLLLKYIIPTRRLCLLAKIGWANKLKNDSFPDSIFWFFPKVILGAGITLALNLYIWVLILIPISFKLLSSLASLISDINPSISLFLSTADLMVAWEIFFRLNSSKSSGMPVMRQISGTIYVFCSGS